MPIFFTNIISNTGTQRELYSQYSIGILPFLILSSLDSIHFSVFTNQLSKRIYKITLLLTVIAFIGYSRIGYFHYRYFPRLNKAIELNLVKNSIPVMSSVLTTDHLAAHFSARELIHNVEDSNYSDLQRYSYWIFPNFENSIDQNKKIGEILEQTNRLGFTCSNDYIYFEVCKK